MKFSFGWTTLLVLLVALFAMEGSAQEQGGDVRDRWVQKYRERWREMPPEQRREMRERFRQWNHMEPESRERRLERAQRLKGLVHEVYMSMDGELKAQVDALEPSAKKRYLVRLALDEARKRGREYSLRGEGPRGRGPGGPPPHGAHRGDRSGDRSAEHRDERHAQFQAQVQKSLQDYVQANGLPLGVSQADWEQIMVAQGREQGHLIRELVRNYPELRAALPKPPWAKPMDPRREVLHHAMRLRPESHLRLIEAAPAEREGLEWTLRKAQVLEGMRSAPEFEAAEVEQVSAMDAPQFRAWLEANGMHPGSGFRPGRGHPRGERGRRPPPPPDHRGGPGSRPPRRNKGQKPGSRG